MLERFSPARRTVVHRSLVYIIKAPSLLSLSFYLSIYLSIYSIPIYRSIYLSTSSLLLSPLLSLNSNSFTHKTWFITVVVVKKSAGPDFTTKLKLDLLTDKNSPDTKGDRHILGTRKNTLHLLLTSLSFFLSKQAIFSQCLSVTQAASQTKHNFYWSKANIFLKIYIIYIFQLQTINKLDLLWPTYKDLLILYICVYIICTVFHRFCNCYNNSSSDIWGKKSSRGEKEEKIYATDVQLLRCLKTNKQK